MQLIIDENGNNLWQAMALHTVHCDVRRDYMNTPIGIKPEYNKQADL